MLLFSLNKIFYESARNKLKNYEIKTFFSLKIHFFFHIFMYWACYLSINEEQLYCDTG